MLAVHKARLRTNGPTSFDVVGFKKFLTVKFQRNRVVVWYLVDPEDTDITFASCLALETGEHVDENLDRYIGSCMTLDNAYVVHVFDVT